MIRGEEKPEKKKLRDEMVVNIDEIEKRENRQKCHALWPNGLFPISRHTCQCTVHRPLIFFLKLGLRGLSVAIKRGEKAD